MGPKETDIWERYLASYKTYLSVFHEFKADGVDRVSIVREGLRSADRWTALKLAQYLDIFEHMQLLDSYVCGASTGNSGVGAFRALILGLPRDWLLERIEGVAEFHIANGTEDEYRRFLELYFELDRSLTRKLALRALAHTDPEIQEAGQDFLQLLDASQPS